MPEDHRAHAERAGVVRRAATLGVVAAVLLACAWLTALVPPSLILDDVRTSPAYDEQALAWLDGRWDVPLRSIPFEAFIVDHRYYMYFGPTPALLRLPFAELLTRFPQKAGFLSLFLAVTVGFFAALRVFEEVGGHPPGPMATVAMAGPPLIIASRTAIYHDAIAWGAAFALLAALHALRYLRSPSRGRLAVVAVNAILAAFARETWLLGMIVLLAALGGAAVVHAAAPVQRARLDALRRLKGWMRLPEIHRPAWHAATAVIAIGSMIFVAAAIHRAKYGTWGFVPPIERHVGFSMSPQRLAQIGHRLFHLTNLRTGVYNYLSPTSVGWAPTFPWLQPAHPRLFPETRLDGHEQLMGLPHVAGALMISGIAGIAAAALGRARRDALVVLISLALTGSACFFFVGLVGRYLYDFYPALVVAAGLGWASLGRSRVRWIRAGLAILALYNLIASMALAVTIQIFGGPVPRRMQNIADRVDRAVLKPAASLGERVCVMPGARRIAFRLRAAGRPMDRDDPLVVSGGPGRANFLSLRRFGDGSAAFAFRTWGSREVFGRRFLLDPRDWHDVEVRLDPAGVRVTQDGQLMLLHYGPVHDVLGQPVWLGRNPIGGPALAQRFAGAIECGS